MGSPAHDLPTGTLHLPYDFTVLGSSPTDSWTSMEDIKPPRGLPSMPERGLPERGLPERGLPERGLPERSLPERGLPGVYLSCLDMLLSEDAAWLLKRTEVTNPLVAYVRDHDYSHDHHPDADRKPPHCKEPDQCPVIDSQGLGVLSPQLEGQVEERCLEQVHCLVVGEVLKDIEMACKLLNITPGKIYTMN